MSQHLDFSVSGLNCASCVGRAERAIQAVPGVLEASVNLATKQATVLGDGPDLSGQIVAALQTAGYPGEAITRGAETVDDGSELITLRRNVVLAAVLTAPVFILEMGGHLFPPFHHWVMQTIGQSTSWILQAILTTLVLAGPGQVFFRKGLPALRRGAPDMNALVVLGASAAWIFSMVSVFGGGVLPEGSRAVYFESAAVIVTLILFGRFLEARAKGQAGAAIQGLLSLRAKTARIVQGGETIERQIAQIALGDVVLARPGERFAVDGEVTQGTSWVDESMITGEPVAVEKAIGAQVVAGTINGNGALQYRATAVGAKTQLAQIIRMVQDAQGGKLPIQALADRVTLVFVPVVIAIALLAALVWLIFGPAPTVPHALVACISVLIIACPCAMGLATPTSIMVGTGRGAQLGVLFRKGDALQKLEGAGVVAFDKTGTLTEGAPKVTSVQTAKGVSEADLIALAAALERASEHPLAHAILAKAQELGVADAEVEDIQAVTGMGLQAQMDGQTVRVGAERFMVASEIDLGDLSDAAKTLGTAGETPVFVAAGARCLGVLGLSDPIKPSSRSVISTLENMGLRTAMITGDTKATAQVIADRLGIQHVVAEVMPGEKLRAVQELRTKFGPVAFVGDGINDAPALAEADTGIAIGRGADVAIETASVVLMSGDPKGVVDAIALSKSVMRNIRQNLFWAFAYNVALIPVAAGLLFPFTGVLLSPMLAAGAMALSSVFVVTNALRLKRFQPSGVALDTKGAA